MEKYLKQRLNDFEIVMTETSCTRVDQSSEEMQAVTPKAPNLWVVHGVDGVGAKETWNCSYSALTTNEAKNIIRVMEVR